MHRLFFISDVREMSGGVVIFLHGVWKFAEKIFLQQIPNLRAGKILCVKGAEHFHRKSVAVGNVFKNVVAVLRAVPQNILQVLNLRDVNVKLRVLAAGHFKRKYAQRLQNSQHNRIRLRVIAERIFQIEIAAAGIRRDVLKNFVEPGEISAHAEIETVVRAAVRAEIFSEKRPEAGRKICRVGLDGSNKNFAEILRRVIRNFQLTGERRRHVFHSDIFCIGAAKDSDRRAAKSV